MLYALWIGACMMVPPGVVHPSMPGAICAPNTVASMMDDLEECKELARKLRAQPTVAGAGCMAYEPASLEGLLAPNES